jgi:hypothetical protein
MLMGVTGTPYSQIYGNSGGMTFQNLAASSKIFAWYQDATQAMTLDASGNLGVGATSPSTGGGGGLTLGTTSSGKSFHVFSSSYANNGLGNFYGTDGNMKLQMGALSSTSAYIFANTGCKLVFYSGGAENMTLDASGNLLVGKTSTSTSTVGVELRPSGRVVSTLAASTSADDTYEVYSTGAGAYRFYVDLGGTIHATSIVITAISDQRLKENVRDLDTGLDAIMALKPRRFDWKEGKGQDKKNAAGFIAQEFEEVFPECVGTSKAGEDGIEYKNINHETLIPTLVKAMQEQQALITAQQAALESLTTRLMALESK